jgi:hypothetical protein
LDVGLRSIFHNRVGSTDYIRKIPRDVNLEYLRSCCPVGQLIQGLEALGGNVTIAIGEVELDGAEWNSQGVRADLWNRSLGSDILDSAALEIRSLALRLDGEVKVDCRGNEIDLVLNVCWHAVFLDGQEVIPSGGVGVDVILGFEK